MLKRQMLVMGATCLMLVSLSSLAVFAQSATDTSVPSAPGSPAATGTPIPPPVFTDGRINGSVDLGGLAIYCVDRNNNTHVNTFQNGSITVWGIGDQKYMNLTAAQLRGKVEVPQPPSEMEMQMTQTAPGAATQSAAMTEEPEVTALPAGQTAILLARATTPNGEIAFFSFGADQFALQGHDQHGKFFTYTWTGCSTGTIDNTTAPYLPELETTATVEFPAFATQGVTAEATTSP